MAPTCRIGTSGWQYKHWKGVLYPDGLPQKRWYEFYSEIFDTVEVNNTFYRLPAAATFDKWREQAPRNFLYTLKFSRYGTHIKRLADADDTIGLFLERANRLKKSLGPILVQLPPSFTFDRFERVESFVKAAPRKQRWAMEFRNVSLLRDETYDLLRKFNIALCIHDNLPDHPRIITADWVYLRFHGGGYPDYPDDVLAAWARQIEFYLAEKLDVFAYFNNDIHGYAVKNALQLRRMITGQ